MEQPKKMRKEENVEDNNDSVKKEQKIYNYYLDDENAEDTRKRKGVYYYEINLDKDEDSIEIQEKLYTPEDGDKTMNGVWSIKKSEKKSTDVEKEKEKEKAKEESDKQIKDEKVDEELLTYLKENDKELYEVVVIVEEENPSGFERSPSSEKENTELDISSDSSE